MLEKFNQVAEQTATSVSRRRFLGRFGRSALAAAGAVGAFLAMPREASAGRKCPRGYRWCRKEFECIPKGQRCGSTRG